MEKLRPRKDLKMVVINVIEAEVVVTPKGNLQIFIIKDKKMKNVSKYVQSIVKGVNKDYYDYFSYVCFRDMKNKYSFMQLSDE